MLTELNGRIDDLTQLNSIYFRSGPKMQFFLETRNNYYSQRCAEMNGKLVDTNGDTIAEYGNNGSDIVSLLTILNAADGDLNDIQEYPPDKEQNESNQHAGAVLYFGIDDKGTYRRDVKYTYSVTQIVA
eukprot:741106_1